MTSHSYFRVVKNSHLDEGELRDIVSEVYQ